MNSPSTVLHGLLATLRSSSAFDTTNTTDSDYGILGRTTACAVVVRWRGLAQEPLTFGAPRQKLMSYYFDVELYVAARGDTTRTLCNQLEAGWEVIQAVNADDTLSGTAKAAKLVDAEAPRGLAFDAGGRTWLPMYMRIQADTF